jgi:cellulase
MHQHNTRLCTEEGIGGAHWGPVLAYMSKVEDAATADGSSEFFKIYENTWKKAPGSTQGDNDYWGTKDLNYNCGKLDFTIPSDIAPGDYLLRAEAIALHAAGPSGGAQHYVTCYQLTVTGDGTATPTGVKFPEAYSKDGPGLGFSIHADLSEYPAPGPALYARGTKSDPQLLTFGKISGVPAATGGASAPASSKAPVASSAAATSAAATSASSKAVETPAASSAVATSAAATSAAEAKPTSAVEAKPTEAATSAVASSVAAAPAASSTATPESGDKKYDVDSFATYLEAQPGSDAEFTVEEFIAWLEKVESGSNTAEPTASASASAVASEVAVEPTAAESSAVASATQAPAQTSAAAPSSKKPAAAPSTLATSVRPAPSSGSDSESGEVKEYGRCGGEGYTGSAKCASGLTCKVQNPYYSQCVQSEGGDAAAPTTKAAASSKATPTAAASSKAAATSAAPAVTKEAAPSAAPAVTKEAVSSAAPSASAAPAADKLWTIEELIAFLEEAAE